MCGALCAGAGAIVPDGLCATGRKLDWGAYFRVGTHMWFSPDDLFDGDFRGDDAQKAPADKETFIRNYQGLELDMHDLNYIVGQVEKHGSRAWMWSDYAWHHEDFFRKASKGILQSNWYYGKTFEMKGHPHPEYIRTFLDLEKHGFDQIACGGNWECDWNVGDMVRFCREHIDSDRLKGFLTASWRQLLPKYRQPNVDSVDQLIAARNG